MSHTRSPTGSSKFILVLDKETLYTETMRTALDLAAKAGVTADGIDQRLRRVRVDHLGIAELEYAKGFLNGREA